MHNIPHNLLTISLLFLLGRNLNFQTADLTVETPGRPSNLQTVLADFSGLGYRCLKHRVEQIISF